MKRAHITLCLIARDEAELLPDCLASLRDAVDEMIVVDTGSCDATAELARSAGARVVDHAWQDDFAAARNAALAEVSEGFVLVLDADERLAAGAARELRRAVARDDFDLGLLPLHNADGLDAREEEVLAGRRRLGEPMLLPRLLRYTPDLRWQGAVHEDFARWAQGRPSRALDVPLVHYGACDEARNARSKAARNLGLLERRAGQEPRNAAILAYLARELERAGRVAEALGRARAAWRVLCEEAPGRVAAGDAVLVGTVYAQLLLQQQNLGGVIDVVGRAGRLTDDHPNFWFLAGVAAEQHALGASDGPELLGQAAECYRACLETDGALRIGEAIPGSRGWQAWMRLGTVELRRDRPGQALAAFDRSLAAAPDGVHARLGRVEALLMLGEGRAALSEVAPLVEENQVDGWLLAALAASQVGAESDALRFTERAIERAGEVPLLAPHRRALLEPLCESAAEPPQAAAPRPAMSAEAAARARSIVVLGSGRSGTSMVTGCLAEAGWDLGGEPHPARDSNPKGFFETFEVNGINEALIAGATPAWCDLGDWQRWLAPPPEVPDTAAWAVDTELEARMRALAARAPFVFKDPRFCFTLPAWRPLLGDAGLVCVFRAPGVVAESIVRECRESEYLANVSMDFDAALALWCAMYRNVLRELSSRGDWLFLHYDQLLCDEGLDRLEAFARAPIARDFPEAALSRTRSERPVTAEAAELYAELCALAEHAGETLAREASPHARAPAAGQSPELSVILCTYDRVEILERSLAAWEAQTAPPGSFELVVVDDGSTDATAAHLAERTLAVPHCIVTRENGGLAAARNSGIEVARGRLLLLVNDDTIAAPDLVERHLAAHREQAERGDGPIAVLGSFEQPARERASALTRCLEETDMVFVYQALQAGGRYDWTRFWTCNVSVPAELVRRVGGFDESFRHYGAEDTELGLRLHEAGLEVVYDPSARAEHHHVLGLDDLERRSRTVARAWVRLVAKHPQVLAHRDFRWIATLDVDACQAFVRDRLPRVPRWREAARQLGALDIAAIERASGAAAARALLGALEIPLRGLHEVAWRRGLAEGLREQGQASFARLAASRRSVDQARSLLAWPRYDTHAEVDQLLAAWGPRLAGVRDARLWLVHDPGRDGAVDGAIHALETAYARYVPEGAPLDIELVAPPRDAAAREQLGERVDAVIELPGSGEAARRELFDAMPLPRL